MKKYEFTGEEKNFNGITLKRIRRIEDGLLGGWIEKEENLSQDGNCFVYDNARVYGNAKVYDDARVFDETTVYGNAMVYGDTRVYDNANVCGDARVYGDAEIYDNAEIYGNVSVYGNAKIYKGNITGNISTEYDDIIQIQCEKRLLTIIKKDDNILYSIGCQNNITEEEFINRIHNDCTEKGKGLEEYPHRKEYLNIIKMVNYIWK